MLEQQGGVPSHKRAMALEWVSARKMVPY